MKVGEDESAANYVFRIEPYNLFTARREKEKEEGK